MRDDVRLEPAWPAGLADPPTPELPPSGRATDLRRRTARGVVINAAFLVGLNALGALKGFVVAGFLAPRDYGVWGLLIVSIGTLTWLAQIGVDDKYIQQDHPDQEEAFQIAFTLQAVLCGLFVVLIAAAVPLFALAYGEPAIVAPGLALALMMPAVALQTPLWVHYRRLDFARQRTLQAFDPLVGFAVTVGLAVAGLGVWALVLGALAGAWAAAIAAIRSSPYKLALRYTRGSLREYASFSWPLLAGSASAIVITQVPILIAQRSVGIAAVGAIALAASMSQYAARVDEIVTQAIYPAICAAKDRADLLFESFTKSNRLALLWGVPCGTGIVIFAPDIVHFWIGERWRFAVPVIQAFGVSAALNQIGFNWSAFLRARGRTRPMAVAGAIMTAAVLAIAVPLLLLDGARGYAIGMAVATAVYVVVRTYYLSAMFPTLRVIAHVARGAAPTVPAALGVLGLRAALGGTSSVGELVVEVVAFLGLAAAFTALSERALVREVAGYLRRAPADALP